MNTGNFIKNVTRHKHRIIEASLAYDAQMSDSVALLDHLKNNNDPNDRMLIRELEWEINTLSRILKENDEQIAVFDEDLRKARLAAQSKLFTDLDQ